MWANQKPFLVVHRADGGVGLGWSGLLGLGAGIACVGCAAAWVGVPGGVVGCADGLLGVGARRAVGVANGVPFGAVGRGRALRACLLAWAGCRGVGRV